MHHEEMPDEIKAVLHDYKDVFPSDLPPGLPPVRKGHEFRIDLEDDTPPCAPADLQVEPTWSWKSVGADPVHAG